MQKVARLKRELQMLQSNPPPGVSCSQDEEDKDILRAQIVGSEGTPYHGGVFHLTVTIPDRYPFEPPKVVFQTPIYHPNIDSAGRICLDSLKMPPQGAWKPSLNIGSLLTTIQLLMSEPNPDDPLVTDISSEYKYNRHLYNENAKSWTRKHAMSHIKAPARRKESGDSTSSSGDDSEKELFCDNSDGGAGEGPHCSGTSSNSRKRMSSDADSQSNKRFQKSGDGFQNSGGGL